MGRRSRDWQYHKYSNDDAEIFYVAGQIDLPVSKRGEEEDVTFRLRRHITINCEDLFVQRELYRTNEHVYDTS